MINKPKILKKAGHHSITEAMLVSLCIALLLGILVGIVLKFSVDFMVRADYLSEKKIVAREHRRVEDLQDYITNYDIKSTDLRHINEWIKSDNYLYVLLYKDGELYFESGNFYIDTRLDSIRVKELKKVNNSTSDVEDIHEYTGKFFISLPTHDALFNYAHQNDEYTIQFEDDELTIRVAEYSEYMYYALGNFLSVLSGIIIFLGFLIFRIHALSARIRKLGNDVVSVAAGDIEHEISVDGHDEVANLSSNVDNMRQSLVFSYKKQKDAQQANAELITAMSHDIRTPLTVLLGYIDMMKLKNDDDELADYIQASEHTALRLKRMSDDMFNYFRLFGGTELNLELEVYSASTLLSQLLEEHIFMLNEKGYVVDSNIEVLGALPGVEVKTDAPQLARVVENIFSNILKYADKGEPVRIYLDVNEEKCKLLFINNVAQNLDNVESNKIGLKTCAKITNSLDIEFDVKNDGDIFTVEIAIPTYIEEVLPLEEEGEENGIRAKASAAIRPLREFFAKLGEAFKSELGSLFRRKKK